MIYVINSFHS